MEDYFYSVHFMDEKEKKEFMDDVKNTFYKDKNINNLIFLGLQDDRGIFKYDNEILYYDTWEQCWDKTYSEILNYSTKDKCELAKLINDTNPNIEFHLYPFFSKETDEPYIINPEYIINNIEDATECVISKEDYKLSIHWKKDLIVTINSDPTIYEHTYTIENNGKFMGGFIDHDSHFQLGDAYTNALLLPNGDLVIMNMGDVSSLIIIKLIHE